MERGSIVRVFVASLLVLVVRATCPHEEDLASFADIADNYDKSSVVTITEATLLDVSVLYVKHVIVEGSGSLVFNRGHDITIKTEGIIVRDNAKLVIGSEACPHEDNVNIYLEGTRTTDRTDLGPEGDKGIMVTDNGSLQIFGQEKLAWTKLAGTVQRFNHNSSNVKFTHLTSADVDVGRWMNGLAFSIFNSSLERRKFIKYNYKQGSVNGAHKIIRRTKELLAGVTTGELVTISLSNKWIYTEGTNITDLYTALETAAGMPANSLALREARMFDAWSLTFVSGSNNRDEAFDPQIGKKRTRAVASVDHLGYKVSAVSVIHYMSKSTSYMDVNVIKPAVGYPEISLLDDVTSWNVGDEVLLTSTDFAWHHAEVRRIKQKVGTNKLVLDEELYYRHFGEIENRVDMRGEVALLSRNIKIQGVMSPECPSENGDFCDIGYDTYGGHVKVHESFGSVHIEGVELQFMGQTSDRGFYPLHFHMCRNITGKTAILRRNSIHHTFRRAITVHGTYGASETALGVQLIENVAYDVLGHAFFMEDGAEMATLVQGNLGANIRKAKNDFETDRNRPSVFWITNPKVIMVGNVASGSQSMGIWYTFPREPVGLSEGLVYSHKEAKHTALWRFDNNVVHSNKENGMFFDNILDDEDGKVVGCMEYEARVNPLESDSPWAKVQLVRLTAYKNEKVNMWLRGGYFEVIQYSSAESKRGIHIARGSKQQMFVRKSMIIGQSVANHEDQGYPDAQNGESLGQYIGAMIHDGPTYYDGCWFQGFAPNTDNTYKAGAVGFAVKNKFTSSVVSTLTDLRFGFDDGTEGNRLFNGEVDNSVEGFGDFDSDETATLRDGDGSVTNCPNSQGGAFQWQSPTQLVAPGKHALTDKCVYRENWDLAACNDKYGKIKIMVKGVFGEGSAMDFPRLGQMKRHELGSNDTAVEDAGTKPTTEYLIILGSDKFYYSFQFAQEFPKKFRLDGRGLERDYGVTVGACLPEGAVYGEDFTMLIADGNDKDNQPVFVDSLAQVMNDTTSTRAFRDGRFVYVRLSTNRERDSAWNRQDTDHNAGRIAPKLKILMLKEMAYTPCFTPTENELSNTAALAALPRHECDLPKSQPDDDWGAGDTREPDRDGNWGAWSSWATCCFNDGETIDTSRYRVCDNPPARGDGADCGGDDVQTKTCDTPCPVDGYVSEWSRWSDCFCDGVGAGSTGVKTRTRECLGTAYGGKTCEATTLGTDKCVGDCGYFTSSGLPAEGTYDTV